MKTFFNRIVGLICIIIMVVLTYVAYKAPQILGFDNPSRILGVIGFLIGLRIAMKLVSATQ